jgi:uncharacterized membrane protein YgcG
MGPPVEPNRKGAPVLRLLVLLAIIIALFIFLPPTPAVAWSSVPFLLLSAALFDAYRRGRRLLLRREAAAKEEDPLIEGTRWIGGLMIFHAVWTGLGASGPAMADGAYVHGTDAGAGIGGDLGGMHGGGIDAGGMDAGGGGSF